MRTLIPSSRLHLLLLLLALPGCEQPAARPVGPSGHFDDILFRESSIVLAESEADPIVGIERAAISDEGLLALADHRASRVRIFSPEGELVRTLGRPGEGPGEFRLPFAVEFGADGSLLVSDVALGRMTRYTPSLEPDTAFPSFGLFTYRLLRTDEGFLAGIRHERVMNVFLISEDGELLRDYPLPDSAAYLEPQWGSILDEEFAVFRGRVVVATNLLYPLWRFDAGSDSPRSFGHPPPSFHPSSPPDLERFSGERQKEVPDWLRTLSVIAGVFTFRDSLLAVVHGRFEPLATQLWNIEHTAMDVYDREYRKVFEDIPLPGRVVAGGEHLVILESAPPEGWILSRYTFR